VQHHQAGIGAKRGRFIVLLRSGRRLR